MKEKIGVLTNVKHEKYVQNLVNGMSQRQAYKDAFQVDYDNDAIDSNASTLFRQTKVRQRYNELIKELEDIAIMSAKERMVYLTNLLLDNEIDTNAKLKAMDILNKMSGEYITKIEADVNNDVTINIELSDDE